MKSNTNKSLRNSSANMDVLVAMGSSVAYIYSVAVLIALTLGSTVLGHHVYFETSAMIITLIVMGKLLEARAKEQTSEAIKKLIGMQAKTAMWLAVDGQASAIIGVADTIKDGSKEAVKAMQEQGLTVIMMTGDNKATAQAIAAEVGIAIGAGTDVAMETADVTLMHGDLRSVPQAIKLSATMRNIHENLGWAFGYNIVLIPIAAGVLAPFEWAPDFLRQLSPILAAGAMAFSSVSVVTNSLRLKRVEL